MTKTVHTTLFAAVAGLSLAAAPAFAQNMNDNQIDTNQNQPVQSNQRATNQDAATTQPSAFMLVVPVPVAADRVSPDYARASVAPDAEAIRDTLASATEAAIAGEVDDFVERLVDADRNRLGEDAGDLDDAPAVKAAAERVREVWQARFDTDFDLEEEAVVYAPFQIIQGTVSEDLARLARARIDEDANAVGNDLEDFNLERGREIAIVTANADGELPSVVVPMIDEAYGWKIDAPESLTAAQLKLNLATNLTEFAAKLQDSQMDQTIATRQLTQHVLLAVFGGSDNAQTMQQ